MMPKETIDFFNRFGKRDSNYQYWERNTPTEKMAIDIAEKWQDEIQPGHGMFFDFSQTPELEKPVLAYLKKGFGWKLETPFFIRK